jgi:hypothetical protein
MSALVSVEQVKDALGIKAAAADTVDDATLSSVVFRASAIVESYLLSVRPGFVGFAAGSNSRSAVGSNTRLYHGTGTDTIFIDDASSIASVTVDATAISSAAYVVEPLNTTPKRMLTYVLPFSSIQGLLPSIWNRGTANVAVTGYWGINYVPDDVQQVALAMAVLIWQREQDGIPPPTGPNDPEALGILSGLDWGWRVDTVGGAGVSFGGTGPGGSTY